MTAVASVIILFSLVMMHAVHWRRPRPMHPDERWVVYAECVWSGLWSVEQQGLET